MGSVSRSRALSAHLGLPKFTGDTDTVTVTLRRYKARQLPVIEPVNVHAGLQALRVQAPHELFASRVVAELAACGEDTQPLRELVHLRCQPEGIRGSNLPS